MFKKLFLIIIAIIFPFVVFFIKDKPGAGFVAILLQGSILGWPVAIIWALKVIFEKPKDKPNEHT